MATSSSKKSTGNFPESAPMHRLRPLTIPSTDWTIYVVTKVVVTKVEASAADKGQLALWMFSDCSN